MMNCSFHINYCVKKRHITEDPLNYIHVDCIPILIAYHVNGTLFINTLSIISVPNNSGNCI